MTLIDRITYVCPICGAKSSSMALKSTSTFGASDLDTRPPEKKRSTLGLELQICRSCHYVSYDMSEPVSEDVKQFVLSDEYRSRVTRDYIHDYINLSDIFLCDKNYLWAFLALLKAAWVADDIPDEIRAAEMRKKALYFFDNILEHTGIMENNADVLTLIKADLYRRTGNFDQVMDLCSNYYTEDLLIADSLEYEMELAAKGDTGCHTVRY